MKSELLKLGLNAQKAFKDKLRTVGNVLFAQERLEISNAFKTKAEGIRVLNKYKYYNNGKPYTNKTVQKDINIALSN